MNLDITGKNVRETVWPWDAPKSRPSQGARIRKAIIQSLVGGTIGALLFFFAHRTTGTVVFCIAAVILLCGLAIPPAFAAIEKFGHFLARVVGGGLTWLLLVPFFYIVFGIGRLALLLLHRDPLRKKCPDPGMKTYWLDYEPPPGDSFYGKQF